MNWWILGIQLQCAYNEKEYFNAKSHRMPWENWSDIYKNTITNLPRYQCHATDKSLIIDRESSIPTPPRQVETECVWHANGVAVASGQ